MQGNTCPIILVKMAWKLMLLLASLMCSGRARLETAPLEEGKERGEEEKEFTRGDDRKPDFSDI